MTSFHRSLVSQDTPEHRLLHDIMNSTAEAMKNSDDRANKQEDHRIVEEIFYMVGSFAAEAYDDSVRNMTPYQRHYVTNIMTTTRDQFLIRVAFELGMRLGPKGRDLFANGHVPFTPMTDDEWAKELKEEEETVLAQDKAISEWKKEFQAVLGLTDEEFEKFQDSDAPIIASSDKMEKIQEVLARMPGGANETSGHVHGPECRPTISQPEPPDGTGQYL